MREIIEKLDDFVIEFAKKASVPLARLALFTVYFWFGILKIFDSSPAEEMVSRLLAITRLPIAFENFIVLFSIYEILIGISFLVPRLERLALILLFAHMGMTVLPLILLPGMTWTGFFVPTLEGQYIIKNIVILALAISIAARLTPLNQKR